MKVLVFGAIGSQQFHIIGEAKKKGAEVHKAAPNATIIVSHMEAVNHYTLSRHELRIFLREKGISTNVLVPDDSEAYTM